MAAEKGHILVAEDDDLFRETLVRNLAEAGYRVEPYPDGQSLLDHIGEGRGGQLVLLDWKMPGLSGIEVLKRMRETGCHLPVIFLTVLTGQIYEEAALLGGAIDFVDKSRSFAILERRIGNALQRRQERPAGDDSQAVGDLTLKPRSSRAFWKGDQVDLTVSEYRLVAYMAMRAGEDVRYRELYDLVRGAGFAAGHGDEGYRANVRAFVKRVRQKFRDIDGDFEQIENYAGFGYRWRDPSGD